ncbi:Repressible high-affinity phosphate permease [Colletotrichum aenigma]|uniref:Repressible high-affinity phosphate permease n=1 Tax=Colletotrichum aenigma TaxID=1215731 RepID=UPI0018726AFD|nr:Repressible high-affinity phosphate permease [Colletotrichum aenigma]KAF5517525.1 Repressible high-affinity phosphate permease [Colletotrichum aenigma]
MSALSDPLARRNRGFLGSNSSALPPRDDQDRRQLRYELDLNSWNLRIWGVAASGFLTDSYNLFSTNVILASIAFVYWPSHGSRWQGLLINFFTLLGSVIGQLLFGFLADFYGRTRLYGIELVLVVVSTIGVATSSYGFDDMSFLGLFIWWRFVMGIGIGAEYPLSAVITSEWSSTQSRGTMISSTFMMQPIGQALAQLVGLWVLVGREQSAGLQQMQCGLDMKFDRECRRTVDGIWRIVIGSGAVPALLAIIFRFFLFDCGLYSLEVRNKPGIALRNTQRVYGAPPGAPAGYPMATADGMHTTNSAQPMPIQFSKEDLYKYFIEDGNWYYLLGTAATWFFLEQAKQYLLTVSLASIAGSACFVIFANRIPRRLWLTISFFVLAILFVITGCVYYGVNRTEGAPATIVFVALCHFMFNFGANTLTFIIPAEIFPTCYRCTCHGISAAAGKLGSIVALLVVYGINSSYTAANRQGLIFLLFGSFVAIGAVFSWAYLPDSQRWTIDEDGRRVLEQKTLEELGEGRERARQLGEVITVKDKWHDLKRRRSSPTPSQATDP